ncbi:hypothetical protein J26TS2_02630 [Shouchella clausii]|nr:hypothetical protein J26TS2_02630 [Shouchella clausii]
MSRPDVVCPQVGTDPIIAFILDFRKKSVTGLTTQTLLNRSMKRLTFTEIIGLHTKNFSV